MSAIEADAHASGHLWREEIRATLALAWPLVLTNLAQTAMTATDVMILGRVGPATLAAGALGANLYFAPLIFGLGLMLATVPMMAREVGRRRNSVRDLRRTVRQGLWVAVLVALPIWALLWNGERILLAMGQEPALARDAGHYLRTLQWGLLPFFLYVVLRSFIASLERPGWATVVAFIGVIINLAGNLVLVFGHLGFPEMGIVGSGLATSIANFAMFLGMVLVVTLDRRFRRYRLFGRFWRADWQRLRQLLWLGMPIAAMMAFETTLFNAAAFMMGLIGASSLAAYAVVIQLCSVSFMIPLGINQAATVRVGIAYGAHDPQAIARAGWTSYAMGVGFMALSALVMMTLPRVLLGAFIDVDSPANAEVVALATGFLAVAALFQIVDGAQAVAAGMLRGLQDTTIPMIYAAFGYWGIGLPLGIALAFHFGFDGVGVWIGLSAGLAVVAVLLLARWLRRHRLPAFRAMR
ncbi:MATE family efflux transporter [Aquamicrobium defluvii]|uniref:Multidrug-efflux transporter n=1 Tax=Aquamicrobium defluvii TaxID=69279 RepID=A0A011V4S1_9HYPH|nr:MATE family efflux transporter [Aquamicrobium defluvii]EXL03450.1 multidrug transporter MatE [Aquamicrobium defluvii]EZQ14751.1 multidrug transporter MatE [Halopseudomonas bauzanensis]TDR33979.1 MATE family multidrug resistance protein [Aquamicrobium defluvii]